MYPLGLNQEQLNQIESDFEALPVRERKEELALLFKSCTMEEVLCLKFLYSCMPASDLVTYECGFFLKAVRDTLAAREKLPWGEKVTGELFFNYVLPVRLNNENLTDHRNAFFQELYPRVERLALGEAALEVNYWCLERATYRYTDDRTLSPLGVIKNAFGRCGEESVLCVSALRSVGIPARQCYTPRWAHCDDNHAWVEVWTGEGWHFIGACEPEPVLDKGWFVEIARRGMLVHARAFTHIASEPEITNQTPVVCQINLLNHYARVKRLSVEVTFHGIPVEGAEVQFQLINFAQLFPLASIKTDTSGKACLVTGYGDLYVQVIYDNCYLYKKADHACTQLAFRIENAVAYESGVMELDMVPPPALPGEEPYVSPELDRLHKERIEAAEACRKAYEATFLRDEKANRASEDFNEMKDSVASLLLKANGNWEEILDFLRQENGASLKDKVALLSSLKEKDLSDTGARLLAGHVLGALPYKAAYPEELFVPYVLCPRVDFEQLTDYRESIANYLTEEQKADFRENPRKAYLFVQTRVADCGERDYATITASPWGLLHYGYGSALSRNILFVALCRTLGVPSRLSPVDKAPEFWQEGWHRLKAVEPESDNNCDLVLIKDQEEEPYVYEKNLTVARLENGVYRNLGLHQIAFTGRRVCYSLEEGHYRVMTANRLPDGTVLAELTHVRLERGQTAEVLLRLRKAQAVEGKSLPMPIINVMADDVKTTIQKLIPKGQTCALAFIETGKEPVEHLLNEISEQHKAFKVYGQRLVFICMSREDLGYPLLARVQQASGIRAVVAQGEALVAVIKALESPSRTLPLVVELDTEGLCTFQSSGYNVGTGDRLLNHFRAGIPMKGDS